MLWVFVLVATAKQALRPPGEAGAGTPSQGIPAFPGRHGGSRTGAAQLPGLSRDRWEGRGGLEQGP